MLEAYYQRSSWWLKILLPIYGQIVARIIYAYYWLCHFCCRIEVSDEFGSRRLNSPRIFLVWHQNVNLMFSGIYDFSGQAWINHPLPYMAPWYYLGKMLKIEKMIPGSTGHDGRQAADQLVPFLKEGHSTGFTPDGPQGPPKILKKGAFHISMQSGAPIVPIQMSGKFCFKIPSWDKKIFPIPFLSQIFLRYGPTIYVTEENFDESMKKAASFL